MFFGLIQYLKVAIASAIRMMNSASVWMLVSFLIAGLLHEVFTPERMKRSAVCSAKVSGVFWATLTGMFVPICSCGTIPLGISLYYSGVYLGPTLSFMTSTPMINPIALILSYGLLGPQIATVYLITGFAAPMIIGIVANRLAGKELFYQTETKHQKQGGKISLVYEERTVWQKMADGLRWSFTELAVTVSKYMVSGMLIAGLLFSVVPQNMIQDYLGNTGFISLLGITVIAAVMYVCAVGHIPFIAALVASGAAPGVAITFLMAGAGTNIAELITIRKMIGKRAMFLYSVLVVILSNVAGYITNRLFPDFKPVFSYDTAHRSITSANRLILSAPEWLKYLCTTVLIIYAFIALVRWIQGGHK